MTLGYGRQSIDEDDIQAVVDVLRGEHLTCGPAVPAFEAAVAAQCGAAHAVAVANGTSALRLLYRAAGIGPGSRVGVPAITFVATASQALALGAEERISERRRSGARSTERGSASSSRRRPSSSGRREVPSALRHQLDVAPLFHVTSLDGTTWYEPFNGTPIRVADDLYETAYEWFCDHPELHERSPLPWRELQRLRWLHELPNLIRIDPRFAVFGPDGQGWVDPFSGKWYPDIGLKQGRINEQILATMAATLASGPHLELGDPLPIAELRRYVKTPSSQEHLPPPALPMRPPSQQTAAPPSDLDGAGAVQRQQLGAMPDIPGYRISLHYEGHSAVSGDCYAVLPYGPGRYLILIGDVTGHGLKAALVVGPMIKALRLLAPL
ncbi:MAG: DegT/DnrJ/EryC1/StrS family aminotransferase, partial [Planctomycetota bacterium]